MRKTLIGVALGGAIVAASGVASTSTGAASATASPSASVKPAPTPCSTGLKPLSRASDEFDGPLDKRWQVYDYAATGQRSRELAYRPDMVRVGDGRMDLLIVDEPADLDGDGTMEYPAGGVESTFDVPGASLKSASCVEVRTKGFAANVASPTAWDQNVFSAVWLQTRPLSYDGNPNAEVDIQEFFETDKMHMALHTWEVPAPPASPTPAKHGSIDNCRTGRVDQTVDPEGTLDDCRDDVLFGDLTQGMHTYGVRREVVTLGERTVGLLTFYLDGQVTWTKEVPADSPFVTEGRHLILSTQGNPPGGPGLQFPKVAEHDWVRTYG